MDQNIAQLKGIAYMAQVINSMSKEIPPILFRI